MEKFIKFLWVLFAGIAFLWILLVGGGLLIAGVFQLWEHDYKASEIFLAGAVGLAVVLGPPLVIYFMLLIMTHVAAWLNEN